MNHRLIQPVLWRSRAQALLSTRLNATSSLRASAERFSSHYDRPAPPTQRGSYLKMLGWGCLIVSAGFLGSKAYTISSTLSPLFPVEVWAQVVRHMISHPESSLHYSIWQTARILPPTSFKTNPFITKATLAIRMHEEEYPPDVYDTALKEAVALLQSRAAIEDPALSDLSRKLLLSKMNAELGRHARQRGDGEAEERRWLEQAAEFGIPVLIASRETDISKLLPPDVEYSPDLWSAQEDVIDPLRRLAELHHAEGDVKGATNTYEKLLGILSRQSSVKDRCQAAAVNLKIVQLLMGKGLALDKLDQTIRQRSLDPVEAVRSDRDYIVDPLCESVMVFAQYNLGMIRELAGDLGEAKSWYIDAQLQLNAISVMASTKEVEKAEWDVAEALDRLDNGAPLKRR